MVQKLKIKFYILFLLGLYGCGQGDDYYPEFEDNPCADENPHEFKDPFDVWFSKIISKQVIPKSNNGLTDDGSLSVSYNKEWEEDCEINAISETRFKSYIYNRNIGIKLVSKYDIQLYLNDIYYGHSTSIESSISFTLTRAPVLGDTIIGRVSYKDKQNQASQTVKSYLTVADSINSGGVWYDSVLVMHNRTMQEYGPKSGIKTFYFSPKYGLIRFDQVDNASWEILN